MSHRKGNDNLFSCCPGWNKWKYKTENTSLVLFTHVSTVGKLLSWYMDCLLVIWSREVVGLLNNNKRSPCPKPSHGKCGKLAEFPGFKTVSGLKMGFVFGRKCGGISYRIWKTFCGPGKAISFIMSGHQFGRKARIIWPKNKTRWKAILQYTIIWEHF